MKKDSGFGIRDSGKGRGWKLFLLLMVGLLNCQAVFAADLNPESRILNPIYSNLTSHNVWLNTSRPLKAEDLEGRIILVDFWTYACINCMHVIPDLKYLEEKFGSDLTVIGVHSAKFKNEQDTKNIKSAILRYGIHHPVVNDSDFSIWNKFGVRAWPTFILIDPKGLIAGTYSGEGNREKVEADIRALMKKYDGQWRKEMLPIAPEENKVNASTLSFPGKIGFDPAPDKAMRYMFYLSDSGHHQMVRTDTNGRIQDRIGSGSAGFKDGDVAAAQFNTPQGVLMGEDGKIYVADTGNHALRAIDLSAHTVTTLAGTGTQGFERNVHNAPSLTAALSSPWDLAFYPDKNHIAIAMAGTHQIWSYDIENKTLSVIAGSGEEAIKDGKYPNNALAQTSGLAAYGNKLYFVDSETSSLRVLENGTVTTLIGSGLFDFGFKDGAKGTALMQHPIGVFADETGVYIADSFNHSIRRYDLKTGLLSTFAGHGMRGNKDGNALEAEFNEPNGITKIDSKFYIADTNNNAIRVIENGTVSTLELSEKKPDPAVNAGVTPSGTAPLPSNPSKQ